MGADLHLKVALENLNTIEMGSLLERAIPIFQILTISWSDNLSPEEVRSFKRHDLSLYTDRSNENGTLTNKPYWNEGTLNRDKIH